MREETRKLVVAEVSRFIERMPVQDSRQIEQIRAEYPFHAAIFSEEAFLFAKQERSIVTRMGMTLFPNLAKLVAQDKYRDVHKDFDISIEMDSNYLAQIDTIVNELRAGGKRRTPNHDKEMQEILSKSGDKMTSTRLRADLFVGDYTEGPVFMEIKSPMPNLDVCAESKRKILVYEAATLSKRGQAYLAFAYNPWVTRDKYAHSFTGTIMDLKKEVLMGAEMWNKLGGMGTYEELLGVLEEVGRAKRDAHK